MRYLVYVVGGWCNRWPLGPSSYCLEDTLRMPSHCGHTRRGGRCSDRDQSSWESRLDSSLGEDVVPESSGPPNLLEYAFIQMALGYKIRKLIMLMVQLTTDRHKGRNTTISFLNDLQRN